jgi:hypothetical protein
MLNKKLAKKAFNVIASTAYHSSSAYVNHHTPEHPINSLIGGFKKGLEISNQLNQDLDKNDQNSQKERDERRRKNFAQLE